MEQEKIRRINELARKARSEGLTEEEEAERAVLRRGYVEAVKSSLQQQLDHTYVIGPDGTERRLRRKERGGR